MTRLVPVLSVLSCLAFATGAEAADPSPTGETAGTFMVRLRAIGVIPQTMSSSISAIGGDVHVTKQAAPEIDLSYFFTDHLAAEVIAASTRHEVYATGTTLGRVDVGSTWVLPPTVTLQYHFRPHGRWNPYVGAGIALGFFYDAAPAIPAIRSVGFRNGVGGAIQAGLDYDIVGPWFLNADIKQIFLDTEARIDGGAIVAKTALDPTVIGFGVGYRF